MLELKTNCAQNKILMRAEGQHGTRRRGKELQKTYGFTMKLLKFLVYFLCIFNTLQCILLLSLCFGSACPPLTLLQLRYILWCFIVYFRIRVRYGADGAPKTRAPGPFHRSTAWGGVSFSAFPAPVPAQALAPPIPRTGAR